MLATLQTATLFGLDAQPVTVEIDIAMGLPGMTIVGLPDKAVEEAKERVRAAINNSGFQVPAKRITVNLAPADVKKEGAGFDLPIAIGILTASGLIPENSLTKSWVVGELALTGEVRHVPGILPILMAAAKKKLNQVIIPAVDQNEAEIVSGVKVIPINDLTALVNFLLGNTTVEPVKTVKHQLLEPDYEYDFAYVRGQEHAKRALEISASGGHNTLLVGPPGSGKTLLTRCLPSILPPMDKDEVLAVSQIYSVAGLLMQGLMLERPFRSPHHTTSSIALVGGGSVPKPGEVTLAHLGVLFLDELPEFPRSALEALRQPLEDGFVTISRAQGTLKFPARFTFIAAQNPCPCGYLTDSSRQCICTPHQILQYRKKTSGPLLDRIDLFVEVPRVPSETLADEEVAEASIKIRQRVVAARLRQTKRYRSAKLTNASLTARQIKTYINISEEVRLLLKDAVDRLHLSARAFHRVIKVARTIADLSDSSDILPIHMAEALQYRPQQDQSRSFM